MGLSVQEKKRKTDFQDSAMAAVSDYRSERFELFLIYKSTRCFLPNFKSTGLSVQEKKRNIDFQDGDHSGHLGFTVETSLAIFDLCHPNASYQVSGQ